MAELGDIYLNDNLYLADTTKWTRVSEERAVRGTAYPITPVIDVRDKMFDARGEWSVSLTVKDVSTMLKAADGNYYHYDSLIIGILQYNANMQVIGSSMLNLVSGGGVLLSSPVEGPTTLNITMREHGLTRTSFIQVVYGNNRQSQYPTLNFEYSKVMVTKGQPQGWIPNEPTDGLVDLETRYSPRIAADTIGVYPLDEEQLRTFNRDLWSRNILEAAAELFLNRDPLNNILSLKYYYGIKGNIPRTRDSAWLTLGNTVFNGVITDSEVLTRPARSEYVQFDAGEIYITRKYNNFLDYAPHTIVEIYIPFYGFYQMNTNEVMGNRIRLIYSINIATGIANANLYIRASNGGKYRLLVQLSCSLGVQIPLNVEQQNDFMSQVVQSTTRVASTIGSAMMATALPNMAFNDMQHSPMSSHLTGGAGGYIERKGLHGKKVNDEEYEKIQQAIYEDGTRSEQTYLSGLSNGISVPQISTTPSSRNSGMDSETGSMSDFEPAVYIVRPDSLAPAGYNNMVGTPDFTSGKIGDFDTDSMNYIKAGAITDGSFKMPQKALDEIITMLKGGVYIE